LTGGGAQGKGSTSVPCVGSRGSAPLLIALVLKSPVSMIQSNCSGGGGGLRCVGRTRLQVKGGIGELGSPATHLAQFEMHLPHDL
jgi:hypothetical protein